MSQGQASLEMDFCDFFFWDLVEQIMAHWIRIWLPDEVTCQENK